MYTGIPVGVGFGNVAAFDLMSIDREFMKYAAAPRVIILRIKRVGILFFCLSAVTVGGGGIN